MWPCTRWKVERFCEGRIPQSDDDFLRDCEIAPNTEAARIAVAARRAVAETGSVDPLFIRADDNAPGGTLDVLPVWDSMDFLTLIFALEKHLDQRAPGSTTDCLPQSLPFTVRKFAERIIELIGAKEAKKDE